MDIEELKHLYIDDKDVFYKSTRYRISNNFTYLHKCVLQTKKFPFLNQHIDDYLKLNPEQINIRNSIGMTALILASECSNKRSSEETVRILLKHKADVNIQDNSGRTALIYSSMYSKTRSTNDTVHLLLESCAKVNITDNNGRHALIHASRNTKLNATIEIVKILLENGSEVNLQDENGYHALLSSILYFKYSTEETIDILLKYGSDVNMRNRSGETALIILSINKNDNLIKKLINFGANPNVADKSNFTALSYSIVIENYECVKNLLENGADVDSINRGQNQITFAINSIRFNAKLYKMLLPNREIFIKKMLLYQKIIYKSELFKFHYSDFKIHCHYIKSYRDLLRFF